VTSPIAPDGSLERAFERFEQAALSLEEHHTALQAKADRLEQQLLDANRRLEAVLDALDAGVAVVTRDGRLARTNCSFDAMGLLDSDGRPVHPALSGMLEAPSGGASAASFKWDSLSGPRDLLVNIIPVGDAEGTRVVTVQDVTEVRREEQEGGRRRRLEALGRMAAELAHEVRNPLGSIRLFASMLHEDLEDEAEKQSMAGQILAATAGLESTVSNLLAFASPTSAARRWFDLAQLAREACSLFAPSCAVRGVRLEGPSLDATCSVLGDPEALRQVVLNLLGNALAATGPEGRIRVAADADVDRVVLQVEDDGKGIASEDLPRVFDPFFTRTEGGTGLGLPIVHQTVERHGGRISLDSLPGRGTSARVVIPLPPEETVGIEDTHA
jgi:signal transduction histidine kinase